MKDLLVGRRLVIAHNPHSSRAEKVRELVFARLDAAGYPYETFEVQQAGLQANVDSLAPLIRPNDIILSAAGDGSAHAIAHAVLTASQPGVAIGFLAFGNFNDLPHTFNAPKTLRNPVEFLRQAHIEPLYPLEIKVNDTPVRNALLYATVGWTAQAAARFDNPKIRRRLQSGEVGIMRNMWQLGWYYMRSRRSFMPEFSENDLPEKHVTDILCINGPVMARLFRSGHKYYGDTKFLARRLNVSKLLPNTPFLLKSLLGRLPGKEVAQVKIEFPMPVALPLQCDGEVVHLEKVTKLAVEKSPHRLHVLSTKPIKK